MKYKNTLSSRMKAYEKQGDFTLLGRTPFIVRLDGNSFSKVTKNLQKPFDEDFMKMMEFITDTLTGESSGCALGYWESDEITLVFLPYRQLDETPFLGGRVQKLASLLAARATSLAYEYLYQKAEDQSYLRDTLYFPITFDARAFNVPNIDEATNCVLWRIFDAERCSTNGYGQSLFTHKELQGIKLKELREKMWQEKGFYWQDLDLRLKRGYLVIPREYSGGCPIDAPVLIKQALERYLEGEN